VQSAGDLRQEVASVLEQFDARIAQIKHARAMTAGHDAG
jgi:hypothetical protein